MTPTERKLIIVLATLQFCHIVDFMIIMPLGKTLIDALDIDPLRFNGLVAVYALAAMVSGLIGAAFIDRFDRRRALVFLFAGFIIGTLACALAPNYTILMICRAFTGLFGGILSALVLAVVGDVFPLERRASAMGWVMTAFSAASVVGVPAGIALAAYGGWRTPFFVIGGLSLILWLLLPYLVPSMRGHLASEAALVPDAPLNPSKPLGFDRPDVLDEGVQKSESFENLEIPKNPNFFPTPSPKPSVWEPYLSVIRSSNQRAALLFSLCLMLGHFTIIPNLATYMEVNIGFTTAELSYIYGIGGLCTVICLPLFGKLADRYGHLRVFAIASLGALFSIYFITTLPVVAIPVALIASSSFFVVASGRSVPANTMITAVVEPSHRGSFMTIRQSVNEAGLFLCSLISGLIIVEQEDGSLLNYEIVGYFTIVMSIVAIYLATRIKAIS
ncbi:MAG: MFS transporter [Bacteroidota bacterium]